MNIKLLTEHNLEFLSLKVGYTGSSEYTLVKMPHCWKSHFVAYIFQLDEQDTRTSASHFAMSRSVGIYKVCMF